MLHSLASFSFYLTIIAAINGPMLSYEGICHAQRLFKPNFLSTATGIHSDQAEETAKHLLRMSCLASYTQQLSHTHEVFQLLWRYVA